MTAVMIGVDPHKGSHAATALDATEHELACLRVRAGRRQVEQLLAWATPFALRLSSCPDRGLNRPGFGGGSVYATLSVLAGLARRYCSSNSIGDILPIE